MIKTLITPENTSISLELPASFVGKQVEIIAFTINESVKESGEQDYTLTHYASQKSLEKDWLTEEEDKAWQNL
ncbi:hypothetical protein GCM10010967_06700 [Dyadobacter beijingensis]|uniref:DUF2281 domain-containing protein n=1 Tax=Dyadobacter beijingensis TaxID=365489 RepID=A0ABQ2HDP2_9BACT|nr:hypothetical protein [Dyadobacter beijingensis]GGM77709.1 hypothetical protein GCM10010967_06700 [Dyadobacter beijingensis]